MAIFDDLRNNLPTILAAQNVGATILYTIVTPGTYDPGAGTTVPTTGGQSLTNSIIEDVSGIELMLGVVEVGDKKISVPAADFAGTPTPGDRITYRSLTYLVQSVKAVEAGGAILLYEFNCRKA